MENLSGKVAFITGGARGIGRAIAEALLAKHIKVCISDVNESQGEITLAELNAEFGKDNAIFQKLDVSNNQQFEGAILAAKNHFGHLDILINNAGIVNEIDWKKSLDSAVIQGINLAQEHLEGKDHQKGGVVINTASISALTPQSWYFLPVYAATKCGVVGLTKTWGCEDNVQMTKVKVNAVCPDITNTPLLNSVTLLKFHREVYEKATDELKDNLCKPRDIAEAVVKLLEDDVTGKLLVVSRVKGVYYFDLPDIV